MTDNQRAAPAVRVYLALGSNLGDPVDQLSRAVVALRKLAVDGKVQCSALYRSRPMGPQDQPDYVNAALSLQTELSAKGLLEATQDIERRHGRQHHGRRWGPRVLDIDILLYGAHRQCEPTLTIPHPGIAQRAFVLYPLADIAPDLVIPGHGSLAKLRAGAEPLGIRRLEHSEGILESALRNRRQGSRG